MKDISELYCAYISKPIIAGAIEFVYSNMQIKKIYKDMIETEHFYFTSRNVSTRFIEERMLDKEYIISESFIVFYSPSKEKCIEWLNSKRDILLHDSKFEYERLLKSEIKEKVD